MVGVQDDANVPHTPRLHRKTADLDGEANIVIRLPLDMQLRRDTATFNSLYRLTQRKRADVKKRSKNPLDIRRLVVVWQEGDDSINKVATCWKPAYQPPVQRWLLSLSRWNESDSPSRACARQG